MRGYVVSFAVGQVLAVALILLVLGYLSLRGSLPAPQIANSQCIDEKLRAMRLNRPVEPNLLVTGSSVAWRHFNGKAAQQAQPGIRPYNAGFCQANLRQTRAASLWLVDRLPSVRDVLLIVSPRDFEGCSAGPATQFDLADADQYVFGDAAAPLYYFRYFDPAAFLRNASGIARARTDVTVNGTMVMSQTGDGPSALPWRGLHYARITPEPGCFAALRSLATALGARGVRLHVTITPMHPEWKARYGGKAYPSDLERRIGGALQGTAARYHAEPMRPDPASFYDAMHLRWDATPAYTQSLVDRIRSAGGRQTASSKASATPLL